MRMFGMKEAYRRRPFGLVERFWKKAGQNLSSCACCEKQPAFLVVPVRFLWLAFFEYTLEMSTHCER